MRVFTERGVHGLTHRAVDQAAGLPQGSTSNLFRTRQALVTAVADDVAQARVEQGAQPGSPTSVAWLELLLLAPVPLELLVVVKCLAHWLTSGLVLVAASPLMGLLMSLPAEGLWAVPAALLLGTPTLTLIGSIGAALLLGSRRGSLLMALLVLPLYIPVLIFGVAAVEGEMLGLGGTAPLLILAALLLLALALAPFATAAALRLASE